MPVLRKRILITDVRFGIDTHDVHLFVGPQKWSLQVLSDFIGL